MKSRIVLAALLWIATSFAGVVHASAAEVRRPNILFILTDDQGWATLGCYGSKKVPTPHLDRLARDGVRFTDAYVMPQCTPTRAALLSGQHTARNGMWHVIPWYGHPWARMTEPAFREQLPRETPSLPKTLRVAGYVTGMAGKWHLTTGVDGDYNALRPEAGPAYGFDFVAPRGVRSPNEGDKWVDHLTDETIRFIRSERERPWFFYLAHHTLHGRVVAPAPLVRKYRTAGAPETGMHNATYLAAIEHLDNSIGRILTALDELDLRDNTLVVFLSDNGGVDTSCVQPGTAGEPIDGSHPLAIKAQEFDNAPLRAGKGSPYEGGIRVPCLVRWPAGAKAGLVCETPVHIVDWTPTLLQAAGTSAPEGYVLDGVDLIPLLRGESLPARPLFWHMPLYDMLWAATPCAVLRDGDWKLIEYFGDWFDEGRRYHAGHRSELYDVRNDIGESRNLAESHAARVKEMREQLYAWLRSIPAPIPEQNTRFNPARMLEKSNVKP